jgi:predicted nucleotide-binding protein (sugar kinase/HSP70/actin superfamily)
MYWGYGQRILRATHLTRRSPGVYAIYCSNYSCGPDSFLLHFYGYLMEGKPCAVIETDGHSGDAGTKTRIEAFLYCVEVDRREKKAGPPANGFDPIAVGAHRIEDVRRNRETLLVPWMGPASDAIAASFRAGGVRAESLPLSDAETLQLGRRHTSGKECLPMCLTLGSLLQRLRNSPDPNARFALLMPKTCGPCRFGVYNLLNRIVLEKLGYGDRMNIWAPANEDYFRGLPAALSALVLTGAAGSDTLMDALHDVRPTETRRGLAGEIYRRYHAELLAVLEGAGTGDLSLAAGLWQIASGRLFGVRDVLQRAANEFKAARRDARLPVVLVVGEIYVRLNAFANGDLIRELERRGLRVKLAPTMEWLEYADWIQNEDQESTPGRRLKSFCQRRIQQVCHQAAGPVLGWPARSDVRHSLSAAGDYLRTDLRGEATLTLGSSIHEWREGRIDAAVFSGPFECMPNKIAEAQGWHLAEEEGLLLLTVSMNGEAMDANNLDTFAFEVKARHARRLAAPATP